MATPSPSSAPTGPSSTPHPDGGDAAPGCGAATENLDRPRRIAPWRDDDPVVSAESTFDDPGSALLALYDEALPQVFGYLSSRCGDRVTAEELCAEVFMAAVASIRRGQVREVTVAWLVGIARHKLVDHWRRSAREERRVQAVADLAAIDDGATDQWDAELDAMVAHQVLETLGAHHRTALTLRYVDGLPVTDVAALLGRTLHATEALLVRARVAFRRAYEEVGA